jgi:hypothetical protein
MAAGPSPQGIPKVEFIPMITPFRCRAVGFLKNQQIARRFIDMAFLLDRR